MPDSKKPNQYLKNLDVQYISLVDAGANLKELVYKAEKPEAELPSSSFQKQVKISKTDEEKQLVYCIVYSPDEVDAHGDAMKADEIEKAAHNFLFEGRTDQVDKQHNEQADQGRVVESYIIGKSDDNFSNDPEGSWAVVIKVLDEDTWGEVKKGTISGVSMQGWCTAEQVEDQEKGLFKRIKELFQESPAGKGAVSKDFNQRLMSRKITQAIYAFEDEVRSISSDEEIEDKKAAVLSVIDDFRGYVSNLSEETNKQFKKSDMSNETKTKAEAPEKNTGGQEEPSETQKAFEKALDKKLDPLQKSISEQGETLEKFDERLKAVEEASPGSQTERGQEEQQKTEKGFKGVPIFGGGLKE